MSFRGPWGLGRREWETPQALLVTDVDTILAPATRTSLNTATLEASRSSIEDY